MEAAKRGSIWRGTVVAWIVWVSWSLVINISILGPRYASDQAAGRLLQEPRYPYFIVVWVVMLFALSYVLARLYASLRHVWGPGRGTALKLGLLVGFAAGFPTNFALSAWAPIDRIIPFWWMIEMWFGSMIAAYLAGWLHKE